LPAPTAEDRVQGLISVSAALPPTDLVAVASEAQDPTLRSKMLGRLTEHGPEPRGSMKPGDAEAITRGIILLAKTDLGMKRPDLAAAALDALPQTATGVDSRELASLRTVALLWSNRIEDAADLDAPVEAWLDGLERAIAEPHARMIVRKIRERFGPSMTPEEAERLSHLVSRLSQAQATDAGTATAGKDHGGH
jgi:hypothetical protein